MTLFKSKSIFYFRNHGLYHYTRRQNWDGMKQSLEAYHQDMLESGKYSSLNAVHLWDDLHSTLTSLTNKFIPSKLSSTRNNFPWVNQKRKRMARQRDRAFSVTPVAPLHKHNYVHQDDPTNATILNEQFQSVLAGSLLQPQLPLSHETTKKL